MPNLLAMSFDGELAPSFDLRCLREGAELPDGWGLGYYAGGDVCASVLKEPAPPVGSIRSELIKAWEHLESALLMMHIRTATWGALTDADTQPFCRTYGSRDWLAAHSGSLRHRLEVPADPRFEPVGKTDTETIFCQLLGFLAEQNARCLRDVDPAALQGWLTGVNEHGPMTFCVTDGQILVGYADKRSEGGLYVGIAVPPYETLQLSDADLEVDLTRRGARSSKGIILSTSQLDAVGADLKWRALEPGGMLVVRRGAISQELSPLSSAGDRTVVTVAARSLPRRPNPAEVQRVSVTHRTSYRYDKAIERSTHLLRLTPYHDPLQRLISNEVRVSVPGRSFEYEDVFGNRARRVVLETPYNELTIESNSVVELRDVMPIDTRQLRARRSIPLVWMPWQGQVLQPYLLPPELPETQLQELATYAMSFVERNDYDLLDTLLDINQTIFEDYEYKQGATTLHTSVFDVYTTRKGVCQDFTNLFICLARMLEIPARYVCGYLYTGPKNPNQVQSEASHAWLQVYLPEMGWKGFDPTNGIVTQTDHVRVAVGRNYVDATPTSGTIYAGGGGTETLMAEVRVARE